MLDPVFNLVGPSSSMGGAAILCIVNGPIREQIGLNSRNNLFGPGNRANGTIGRSIRLILMNACAAIPGLFDRSVIGHPGKYTYCIAEAEGETHWTPLHVERGFNASDSTVTVFASEAPRQVRVHRTARADPVRHRGRGILFGNVDVHLGIGGRRVGGHPPGAGGSGTIAGNSNLWRDWTKHQVREYLHANIQRSVADLKRGLVLRGDVEPGDEATMVSLIPEPDDILLVFAGGEESNSSSVIPSWGPKVGSTAVTKKVQTP